MSAAVVTGAGRGLGLEVARAMAARGLTVNVTDVDGAAAESAASELGGEAWGSALDVRDAEACRATARAAAERGGLAVWVNNAGILATGVTWEQDEDLRRTMLEVNALGTFNGTLAALELMRAAGHGHIINIISLAGLIAAPGEALYAASKHAAIAFTLGTLADLRRGGEREIQLSAVVPTGFGRRCSTTSSTTPMPPARSRATCSGRRSSPPRWPGCSTIPGPCSRSRAGEAHSCASSISSRALPLASSAL